MTVYKFTLLVSIGLFCHSCNLNAQELDEKSSTLTNDSIDSLLVYLLNKNPFPENQLVLAAKFKKASVKDSFFNLKDPINTKIFTKNEVSQLKNYVSFGNGYFSYQWVQRSGADTPFIETNSSQHLIQGSFSTLLADAVPIRVTYIERHSNSKIFQDFRDFRIEFDAQSFFNMQRAKVQKKVGDLESKLQRPLLKPILDEASRQLNIVKSTLNQAAIQKKYLDCKEMLLAPDVLDTLEANAKDSLLVKAKGFVALYEKVETKKDRLQHSYDSLRTELIRTEKIIESFRSLVSGTVKPSEIADVKDSLLAAGLSEKDIKLISEPVSPIRTFAIGRTVPNFSNLTLKNTNVKGLNFEYNKNNFYAAAAAGKIDLRSRDFVYHGSIRPDQFVYSARLGYGKKERTHIIATYYEGRKQISLSSLQTTSHIRGSSITGQLFLFRNTKANIEFAQSFAPYVYDSSFKSASKTLDKNSQALSVGLRSFLPATKTKLEGNYIQQGANFQSFTGYRINGASSSWYLKAEQDLFKRVLHVIASVRKNDLSNPFVIQHYNANSIVRNISATFRKRKIPTITLAMMPSSQYTLAGNQVYENRYRSFSSSIFHVYNIGVARSTSSLVYTRLYNTSSDSGFIYFNARNILFNQSLDFSSFIVNSGFSYTVTDARLSLTLKKPDNVWPVIRNDCSRGFFSYDWTKANNYYTGDSRVNIKRITSNWDQYTKYADFWTTSANQVLLSSNNLSNVGCTSLIQDAVNQPTYGFMFEIFKQGATDGSVSETNYLSACASSFESSGLNGCSSNTVASTSTTTTLSSQQVLAAASVPSCPCFMPQLQVSYSITKDTVITVCRPNITDTTNPYRWGILGNWRMDRAYTYYNDRKESDASNKQTDIRREGTLKDFTTYWKFTDSNLVAAPDTTKWVWNSAMSAYNRKGFEIENYDALGRYNAGLYGYNQTLPIAVAQNAKYREILSDGFEDYDYKTKDCINCESPREIDFRKGQSNVLVTDEDAHTGKYSLKVNAYAESKLNIPLTQQIPEPKTKWYLNVDSTPVYGLTVIGKGQGLSATYVGGQPTGNGCNAYRSSTLYTINPKIDYNWGNVSPYPNIFCLRNSSLLRYDYDVSWSGFIQAKVSGNYRFHYEKTMGLASLQISKGNTVLTRNIVSNPSGPSFTTAQVYLQAGELYSITASFNKYFRIPAAVQLSWQVDNGIWEVVPQQFLYRQNMTSYDTIGSIKRDVKLYCIAVKNDSIRNVIRPIFSPTQGAKMVVNAWVKMAGSDCSTAPALNDVIIASFNNNTSVPLQKTGVRIEGWQRYESVVDVPLTANTLYLNLRGVQGRTVYVDDIRMQPYNSSMKSYVYDPVSLRLMADLDENNYASFYEYDDDGTLIRVKKETEKGVMTIKETRSALLKN